MNAADLKSVLIAHAAWLRGAAGGTRANLRGANLRDADLTDANLRGANLTGVLEALGVPVVRNLDVAMLAAVEREGNTLDMRDWHVCETAHCRAGWAIHLAGDAGYALEAKVGPSAAGALIYAASGSHPTPNFLCSNDEAMADMRARAAKAVSS